MIDWKGKPIAPSRLQSMLGDDPRNRSYAAGVETRTARSLAKSFEHYLEARLEAAISRLEDVIEFLRRCAYGKDRRLFGREEVWLHPEDFERLRAGDCEDHALWAWVRLVRLGLDARFTAGLHKRGGHAWITLFTQGGVVLLETTARKSGEYLIASEGCRSYDPVWSVDGSPRFFYHAPRR